MLVWKDKKDDEPLQNVDNESERLDDEEDEEIEEED